MPNSRGAFASELRGERAHRVGPSRHRMRPRYDSADCGEKNDGGRGAERPIGGIAANQQ